MKMLTVSLLVCAMMALARADDDPTISTKSDDVQAPPGPPGPPAPPAPSCADGWSEFNGRCFHFVPRELSWADAEKNCQTLKGNLASVHSVEEYQHIQGIIRTHTQSSPETWVGASDCQQDNVWLWSDGKAFSYAFWCAGQPDNQHSNQACLQINFGGENCWDDTDCSLTRPSVCVVSL